MNQELTYWVALAEIPKIGTARKNEMAVHFFKNGKNIIDFFESENFLNMELNPDEVALLSQSKSLLGNYSFMVEELLNQGFEIIPITSKNYSPTLKLNLKYNSPIILYTKGNREILQEKAVAIVGSRKADDISLNFTDNVAEKAVRESKVVVSGFAKGVDRQALDSALKYEGKSIIVLPQGILTFGSGFKSYYKPIISGNVLVLSTFHPKSTWSVGLAMARNSTVYGLASEIYVAQSDDKGGTWSGVCDGLKKGRTIFVRQPESNEKCANNTLINMGAVAVDFYGNLLSDAPSHTQKTEIQTPVPAENVVSEKSDDERIVELLKNGEYSSKQIIEILNLKDISPRKLSRKLSKIPEIHKTKRGNVYKFSIGNVNHTEQLSLDM